MRFLTLLCILIGFNSLLGSTVKASEGSSTTNMTPMCSMYDISFGDPQAPINITVYFSPTCHACSNYEQTVLPEIQERFVKTGKVFLVMRLLPFHRLDFAVAKLIWCRKPSFTVHELMQLFLSHQDEWLDLLKEEKKDRAKLLKKKIKEVAAKLGKSAKALKEELEIEDDDEDAFLKLFAIEIGFTIPEIHQALQDNPNLEEALTANHLQVEAYTKNSIDYVPVFIMNGKLRKNWVKSKDIETALK
jgi:hypothetical protein